MIPTYLLKQLSYQLAPALTLLYQASLDQGQLPGHRIHCLLQHPTQSLET